MSGPPKLVGTVEDEKQVPVQMGPNYAAMASQQMFGCLSMMFSPRMFLGAMFARRPDPIQTANDYVLTIRRADGKVEQARMEGDLIGGILNRGDEVSLWGHRRHGVLIVSRGFNSSTSATISLRRRRR